MLSASAETQQSMEQPIKDAIRLPKLRKADEKATGLFPTLAVSLIQVQAGQLPQIRI